MSQRKQEICVEVAYQYGVKRVYVRDDSYEDLKTLTGTETLTDRHIEALKKMGFTFKVVNKEEV